MKDVTENQNEHILVMEFFLMWKELIAAFDWVTGLQQISALQKANGCYVSPFCEWKEKVTYKVAENSGRHCPCQDPIRRQMFGQRWLQLNGCEHCLAVCVCVVAEQGENPRDDRLKSHRAPCGLEMIGRTDTEIANNRTLHCMLLLCSWLEESWAFFANKQVMSMHVSGLCHPFLLLKEKILQGLNQWFSSQTKGKVFTVLGSTLLNVIEEEEKRVCGSGRRKGTISSW